MYKRRIFTWQLVVKSPPNNLFKNYLLYGFKVVATFQFDHKIVMLCPPYTVQSDSAVGRTPRSWTLLREQFTKPFLMKMLILLLTYFLFTDISRQYFLSLNNGISFPSLPMFPVVSLQPFLFSFTELSDFLIFLYCISWHFLPVFPDLPLHNFPDLPWYLFLTLTVFGELFSFWPFYRA